MQLYQLIFIRSRVVLFIYFSCYVSQLTVRTPLTDSGTALTTATSTPYPRTMFASRPATSCFIKDVPPFHPGLPTVLSEVILDGYFYFLLL